MKLLEEHKPHLLTMIGKCTTHEFTLAVSVAIRACQHPSGITFLHTGHFPCARELTGKGTAHGTFFRLHPINLAMPRDSSKRVPRARAADYKNMPLGALYLEAMNPCGLLKPVPVEWPYYMGSSEWMTISALVYSVCGPRYNDHELVRAVFENIASNNALLLENDGIGTHACEMCMSVLGLTAYKVCILPTSLFMSCNIDPCRQH